VGNRANGDRLNTLLKSPAEQRLAAGLLLLSPHLPLLFMGEEYGEENPFPFFCSFDDPKLVQSIREGRKKEFEAFTGIGEVPDPQSEDTFASAKLGWSWPEDTHRAGLRRLYRDMLSARRQWPALRDFERRSARLVPDEQLGPVLELARGDEPTRQAIRAFFNLEARPCPLPGGGPDGMVTLFSSESAAYGGNREAGPIMNLSPFEYVVFGPPSWRAFPG
jgi:maltooligosyltrehalose trehalohydrolase